MGVPVDRMNSLSGSLMFGVTLMRNDPGVGNKLLGQAGYALIALVAVVETVVAAVFAGASLLLRPLSAAPFERSFQWLKNSAFCIGWAVFDFFLNPCMGRVVADERSARQILERREFCMIPYDAIV